MWLFEKLSLWLVLFHNWIKNMKLDKGYDNKIVGFLCRSFWGVEASIQAPHGCTFNWGYLALNPQQHIYYTIHSVKAGHFPLLNQYQNLFIIWLWCAEFGLDIGFGPLEPESSRDIIDYIDWANLMYIFIDVFNGLKVNTFQKNVLYEMQQETFHLYSLMGRVLNCSSVFVL